jgi:twitching motility protein PilT
MAKEKTGLVLVTGATGSGKSTTLAALLNEFNETKSIHIVTLEDPVEFVHPQKKATFNQREMGSDYATFASGLRPALRQAPKVILVGEMRDREAVEIGLSAAETGHLVLSTLHTINAGQTINRIVGMFDQEEEQQIRIRMAETLRWIVAQRLLPKVGGGRVAALEIMGSSLRVRDSIEHGESEGKHSTKFLKRQARSAGRTST